MPESARGLVGGSARALVAAALVGTVCGCAVRTWRPAGAIDTPAELEAAAGRDLRAGEDVRAHTRHGVVEITVTAIDSPYLIGRSPRGSGRVDVELDRVIRADIRRRTLTGHLHSSSAAGCPALQAGDEVQLAMRDGTAALRVAGCEQGVVYGQPLGCEEGGTPRACTGTVRLDLREIERLELRRADGLATVLVNACGLAFVYAVRRPVLEGLWFFFLYAVSWL